MSATKTMTVRVSTAVMGRLEALARSTDRSKAYLAGRAIEEYVAAQEWQVEAIAHAVREADADDAEFLEHEKVDARLERLGEAAKRKLGKP